MKEFINKIQIQGVVGRVQNQTINGHELYRFSVATEYALRDGNGQFTCETTWFDIIAWDGHFKSDLSALAKGKWVNVVGRMRMRKFMTPEGDTYSTCEIISNEVEILED